MSNEREAQKEIRRQKEIRQISAAIGNDRTHHRNLSDYRSVFRE